MPIYEFKCNNCGVELEKLQSMSAPPPDCPDCSGGEMEQKISLSSFELKGTGWYKTDFKGG